MGTILIVEDNRDLADSLGQLLETFGYDVRVVYDGQEALREVDRSVPETIVLDLGLPSVDGLEVARRLRHDHGRRIRIVAHTAWSDGVTWRRVSDAGFDEMITKPASMDRLLAAIRADGPH